MPDKPVWWRHLPQAIDQLEALPFPWVDRATLEALLGVGRRRAQQILQPLVSHSVGKSGLALKDAVVSHLRTLAAGNAAFTERQRRERLHALLNEARAEARRHPRVLVEAPAALANQTLTDLPAGIRLLPGRIVIEGFLDPEEAKQKLLALVLAIGNDPDGFDAAIALETEYLGSL